jgi:hypothetical protein
VTVRATAGSLGAVAGGVLDEFAALEERGLALADADAATSLAMSP